MHSSHGSFTDKTRARLRRYVRRRRARAHRRQAARARLRRGDAVARRVGAVGYQIGVDRVRRVRDMMPPEWFNIAPVLALNARLLLV
ncbi:MAG: hypothetical protein ACRDZ4_20825 [Egibacteraceae bacterium]